MKVIVIKYRQNRKDKEMYGYYFEHEKKQYHYLFRNFGKVGKNGMITEDNPEEIKEWFEDIRGKDSSIAAWYDVQRARIRIEECNQNLGCSHTCDFNQRQKCKKLELLEQKKDELELTKKFMQHVLENDFTDIQTEFYFDQHTKIKNKA